MKIALLRQRPLALGGAEATLGHLARGLAAAGHEVLVLGASPASGAAAALGAGVTYMQVPAWGGKTGRLLTFALNSRRLLALHQPQVILSLDRTLRQDVYRAGDGCHREWLARRRPYLSPWARAYEVLSPFHRVMLALERRLFADPGLHRVIANSRQVREEVMGHYGVPAEKIRVIYNGLDREKFKPPGEDARAAIKSRLGVPEKDPVVLFVGSGFARKGLAYLMEAFNRVSNGQAHLWVVGKGGAAPYLRLATRQGIEERVRFWGPQAEVAPFYQAASVLALPTIYDPCSNVVLEALACGCPVVTTRGNGAREFLTPGVNGAVLDRPEDVDGLAAGLTEYLERAGDPEGSKAAAQAVVHLSWERTVAETLELLEEAAATAGGAT
jgi:UDP-glucose:(heptosyl)LPS alpha-1,3-glucosyltransferase